MGRKMPEICRFLGIVIAILSRSLYPNTKEKYKGKLEKDYQSKEDRIVVFGLECKPFPNFLINQKLA
jgi:hypothetical protein